MSPADTNRVSSLGVERPACVRVWLHQTERRKKNFSFVQKVRFCSACTPAEEKEGREKDKVRQTTIESKRRK